MRESESSSITGGYSNEVRGDSEQTCARCMSKDHQPIDFLAMNKKKIILPDEEGLTPEQEKEAEAQLEELLKKRIEKQKVLMKIREAKAKDNR